MAREVTNVPASVLARLNNLARQRGTDFQVVLSRYVLERLLYRLSVSAQRDRYILKGALLFPLWLDDPLRPTRDLDLLGHGDPDPEDVAARMREVMATEVTDDGVVFDVAGLRAAAIRENASYGGVRVQTDARLGSARVRVRIDVGFGDAVVPAAEEVEYPSLLDAPTPRIRAYPRETVVAEKFEAIVALGEANSRMKDYYDLWALSEQFAFRGGDLATAVGATFARRGTALPTDVPVGLTDEHAASLDKARQWRAFLDRERLAADPGALVDVVARLRPFLMPIAEAVATDAVFAGNWSPGGPWKA